MSRSYSSYEFANTDVHTGVGSKSRDGGGGGGGGGRYDSFLENTDNDGFFYDSTAAYEGNRPRESHGRHDIDYGAMRGGPAPIQPQQQQQQRSFQNASYDTPYAPRVPREDTVHRRDVFVDQPEPPHKRTRLPTPTNNNSSSGTPATPSHRTAIPGYSYNANQRTVDALEKEFLDFTLSDVMPLIDRSGPPGTSTFGVVGDHAHQGEPTAIPPREYAARLQKGRNDRVPEAMDSHSATAVPAPPHAQPPPAQPPPPPPAQPPPPPPTPPTSTATALLPACPPYRLRAPIQTLIRQYRGSCIANRALLKGETLCEYYSHSPYEVRQRVGVVAYDTAQKTFKKLRFKPSIQQRQVLTWMFRVGAKFLLCGDYRSESHRLFREWGIARESAIVGYLAMRRGGKTELSGSVNGNFLFFSDFGLNEACFSTQQAISNLFVATVTRFFIEFCEIMGQDPRRRIISSSASRFCVTKFSHYDSNISHAQLFASGDYNDCVGLSGNITGQKGRRINIMNLDECSRIPFKVIRESAAPHMTTGSVVYATSTTMGTDDPFTALFQSDDPYSNEVMALFQMKSMCDDCQERGLPPQLCTHMDHLAPAWLDPELRKRAELLIQDTNIAAREIRGVAFNDEINAIPEHLVDHLFNVLPRVSVRGWMSGHTTSLSLRDVGTQRAPSPHRMDSVPDIEDANMIAAAEATMFEHESMHMQDTSQSAESKLILFSFVDIGGYSTKNDSQTSVSTIMWLKKGKLAVLVGCASGNMPEIVESRRFFQHYFATFLSHRVYREATHVIAVEHNFGGSAFCADAVSEIIRMVLPNMMDICEKPPKVGVYTGSQSKCDAAVTFVDLITFDGLRIAREEDFITVSLDAIGAVNSVLTRGAQQKRVVSDDEVRRELSPLGIGKDEYSKRLDELRKQLKRVKRSRTKNGGSAYSGKGKPGSNMRDDDYMTWSASILWSKKFLERVVLIREAQMLGRVFLNDMESVQMRNAIADNLERYA